MEKIIANSVSSYLRVISDNQFGFLSHRSTCTQLLATLNDWTSSQKRHMRIDAVFIDLVKEFHIAS